jgi:hypothetical protein
MRLLSFWVLLGLLCVLLCACKGSGPVSEDPVVQASYLTALRTRDQLRERRARSEDISADCIGVRAVLRPELQGLDPSAARSLLGELDALCPPEAAPASP